MKEKPRLPSERLVNPWMLSLIGVVSVVAGLMALSAFTLVYRTTGDLSTARSMAFITLGLNSLAYVFSVRAFKTPFWRNHLFENRWLIAAVVAGLGLQLLPFSTSALREFFGLNSLGLAYWLIAIGLSVSMFFVIEAFKLTYQLRE